MPSSETNIVEKKTGLLFFRHILSKVFLEDWLTKLVALAITLALWIGVTGLSTPTTRRMADIPLTLSYSNKTEITNSPIQAVSIVISGDKRKINQITEAGLVVSLDLSDVQPGDRVIQLSPENVSIDLPLGVRLQEIQPSRIAVRLEAVEEKEVAVKVETQGDVPDGFEVYSETATPGKVRVRGPSSYIRSLTSVSTDKIDIGGKATDFIARQTPISLSNPKATTLESVVDVMFKIGEQRVERSFQVPISDGGGKRLPVVLYGPTSMISAIKPGELTTEKRRDPSGAEYLYPVLPKDLEGKIEIRKPKVQ